MKYHHKIKVFIIISVILLFASIFLDDMIADNIEIKSVPIILLSQILLLGVLAFTVLVLMYKKSGPRITLLSSLLLGSILLTTQVLKLLFERIRPTDYTFDFSFPSGHTSFAFSLVPLAFKYSNKAGYTMLVMAILISVSRILLKEHYLSDVVAGGILGYSISWVYLNIIRDDDK